MSIGAPAHVVSAAGTIALGVLTVEGNPDSNTAGSAEAFEATAFATGSLASITVYIDSSSSATRLVAGIYADAGGEPGTLMTQATLSSPTSGAWNTITVPAATVTSGSGYWISVLSPAGAGSLAFRDVVGGTLSENSGQSTLSSLPTTWSPGPRWDNSPISAYATLAPAGPALSVTPTTLGFGATVGGSNPAPSTLSVANAGNGSITFSAATDSPWLSVSPTTGTAPQSLAVGASITGLGTGLYTGHVTVTAPGAQGSPQAVTVTLTVSSPSSPGQGDWPTVDHDPGRSGTAADETRLNSANAGSLAAAWSATLDGKVTAQPLYLSGVQVTGGPHDVVIAATNQNSVYALDANSGEVLWHTHLASASANCSIPGGFGITGTPVVDRSAGRIYAVTDDGVLRSIALADGSQAAPSLTLVANPSTNLVWGGLSLANGSVYFPTGSDGCDDAPWQGGIFEVGVGGTSPQLLQHWITVPSLPSTTAGGGIWGYGGISEDTATNHIYAASSDDGTGVTGSEGYTPYAGSILALDSSLNLLGWYQPPQPPNYNCGAAPPCDQDFASTPVVFHPNGCPAMLATGNKNGSLYITTEPSLEGNGGSDGSHVQSLQLNITIDDLGLGGLYGTPVYSPDANLLYVTDTGPGINGIAAGLVALTVQPDCSLKVAWSQQVGSAASNSPNSTPTLANGVVYVGVNDGSVSAFDAQTGARLWNSGSYGFAVYGAPVVANGRLIAGSWDGPAAADAGTIRAWVASTNSTAPGAPTGLSATAGNASAGVSWTAPANGGSPITAYTVTPYVGGVAQSPTQVTGNPPATSTTVGGLTNGTAYTFTVTATNTVGTGPPSSPSNSVTPSAATAVPKFVQQASSHAFGVASIGVTPSSSLGAGNRLVVLVGVWNSSGATASTVTDSAGDVFTKLTQFQASERTDLSVWSAPITAGAGIRPTITATPTSSADMGIAALEYSGLSTVAGAGVVDQQAHNSGTAASAASGATPATTAGNELAIGFYVDSGWGATLTSGAGYTSRTNVSPTGDMELLVEDQVVAQGATPNAGAGTSAGTVWLMATLVFKSG
jgi:outer membrane protein assembly factor BamB